MIQVYITEIYMDLFLCKHQLIINCASYTLHRISMSVWCRQRCPWRWFPRTRQRSFHVITMFYYSENVMFENLEPVLWFYIEAEQRQDSRCVNNTSYSIALEPLNQLTWGHELLIVGVLNLIEAEGLGIMNNIWWLLLFVCNYLLLDYYFYSRIITGFNIFSTIYDRICFG